MNLNNLRPCDINWRNLSDNSHITWEFVKQHLDEEWDFFKLSVTLPIDDILENTRYDWNWYKVSQNKSVRWHHVKNNIDLPWDYEFLQRNENITFEMLVSIAPRVSINWWTLSSHPQLDFEIVKEHLGCEYMWDWNALTMNKNITWDIIQENPTRPWKLQQFSNNENVNWDIVINNPDVKWDYNAIMDRCGFNKTVFESNPYYRWDWNVVSFNIDVNSPTFEKCKSKLSFEILSLNKTVDENFLEKYIERNWDWFNLTHHPNISLKFIVNHRNRDWSCEGIVDKIS